MGTGPEGKTSTGLSIGARPGLEINNVMKPWLFAVLAGVLLFVGCGTRDRTEGLQQEKLLLDLIKTQSDQLAQLMQKENDLRSLEKKNQEALQEIERQRAALQTLQQETARKDRVAQDAIAQEKAKLQNERDGLEVEKKRVRADELKNQANEQELIAQRKELSRLRASLPPKPPVEDSRSVCLETGAGRKVACRDCCPREKTPALSGGTRRDYG